MVYYFNTSCDEINWAEVYEVIKRAGLSAHSQERTQKAFENSYARVFVFDKNALIGTGRAISDGISQAAIYDIAVLPEYQKSGIGKAIIQELHKNFHDMNIILYANPGVESFYEKLGYSKMLTGMGRFRNVEVARQRGFIK
jgi:ribosomal protein S18 acetylase RimI-like enzyme